MAAWSVQRLVPAVPLPFITSLPLLQNTTGDTVPPLAAIVTTQLEPEKLPSPATHHLSAARAGPEPHVTHIPRPPADDPHSTDAWIITVMGNVGCEFLKA